MKITTSGATCQMIVKPTSRRKSNFTSFRYMVIALAAVGVSLRSLADTAEPPTVPESLPAVTVTATNSLAEEAPMGPNAQPEWTARRRFTIYPRGGAPQQELQQEFELGLPYRFQIDYEIHGANFEEGAGNDRWHYADSEFELRWALAEWGKIPLNPTVKVEWKHNNGGTDAAEANLLFGDELAPAWHWGSDLFYEQSVNGDRRTEKAVSLAVSYSAIDEKLGVGMEARLDSENDVDDRHAHLNMELGPSVQWRITPRLHLDLESLFGVTGFAPNVETFVFCGIDFGPGSEPSEGVRPISLGTK